ncbi:hypothetical protein PM02_13520 [Sulfitobacter mediterraneus]|uniref:Uncharacterized protein n=2 Tax=Sulfitobacter mediterraneus TaxID=83219 RepID=A0A061SS30_9RHOB|nr:hypothetical protein PM02_13520 [Sulfitobacter mediterraneus]
MAMKFKDNDEVLATVQASSGRRFLGVVSLGILGVLLIYIAMVRSPGWEWQLFLVGIGAAALWMAQAMWRATASAVELTPLVLRDADGTVIAEVADIVGMDRGFFAFKPSNGFLLKVGSGSTRNWRPGLWWRFGRRIGIGGMTPGSQTKFMSEIISAMMATRDADMPEI